MERESRVVVIDGRQMDDFASFHRVFAAAFGFPDWYGSNMNAWIDCMSNPDSDWSFFAWAPGLSITLHITHGDVLRRAAPAVAEALEDGVAAVNARCAEVGEPALLALVWADA